ncbi:sulfotransferase [Ruegeria arenilitoris]|nr:sulfotransferase [Ruegeria arenilitoris]
MGGRVAKVFGIGLPKTATTSLEIGFETLGYRKMGYSLDALHEYLSNGYSQRIREMIAIHDAFADWPWSLMYVDLFQDFGRDAKYILTRRSSAEVWVNSMKRHSVTTQTAEIRQSVYGVKCPHGYEAHLISQYEHHNRSVIAFFEQQDALDCLLDLRIGSDNDWRDFTAFLEHEPSGVGFQHSNRSENREPEPHTVFHNLNLINQAQRGLEKPELTLDEALLNVPAPARRNSYQGQAIRMHAKTALDADQISRRRQRRIARADRYSPLLRTLIVPSQEAHLDALRAAISPYVGFSVNAIKSYGLYGTTATRDWKAVEADMLEAVLQEVVQSRLLPNILIPQRHSEFCLLQRVLFDCEQLPETTEKLPNGICLHVFRGQIGFAVHSGQDGVPLAIYDHQLRPVQGFDSHFPEGIAIRDVDREAICRAAAEVAGDAEYAQVLYCSAGRADAVDQFQRLPSTASYMAFEHAVDVKLGSMWPEDSLLRKGLDSVTDWKIGAPGIPKDNLQRAAKTEVVSWSN